MQYACFHMSYYILPFFKYKYLVNIWIFFKLGRKREYELNLKYAQLARLNKAFLERAHTSPSGEQAELHVWCLKSHFLFQSSDQSSEMETQNIYEPQSNYGQTQTNGTWLWGRAHQTMGFFKPLY